jgi:hypothetical protein
MQDLRHKRNEAVRAAFQKLNPKVYTLEYRLDTVAKKFFLKPNTVYSIIKATGQYSPPPCQEGKRRS